MHPTELDALYAFLAAATVTALLTPLTMRLARTVGAMDEPRERGLSERPTPLLGGLAIFAGALVAGMIWLPDERAWHGVLIAAAAITLVGALDDRFDLPPVAKLAGQVLAALVVTHYGVLVERIRLPFLGLLTFPHAGAAITVVGLVAIMNVVNFSDGIDGLAAGVSAIIAATLAVIAFSLDRSAPGVLAALIAGASLGFLAHNFPPASSFMGDCGANLLGLLMGCLAVEGAVKTEVVLSFVLPLILLAVPFLDTTFVLLKRLKYRRPIYESDSEHFHHRMARIGFSRRRTIAYLYTWTLMLAGLALSLRFIPYSDHKGHYYFGWTLLMAAIGVLAAAASVYLVYVLEILKFRRLDSIRLRRLRPEASAIEIEADVARDLQTGEMDALNCEPENGSQAQNAHTGAAGIAQGETEHRAL
ncbi:MAG TPA: MraY family glycosyltransferase [Solirubrobacteraceae bacterium]|jgi:UDP-GlcNAc:undecaprenyl-phosphate GlcNAc-1-phosphate transferase